MIGLRLFVKALSMLVFQAFLCSKTQNLVRSALFLRLYHLPDKRLHSVASIVSCPIGFPLFPWIKSPSKMLRLVRWSNSFLLFLIIFVWGENILNLEFRSPSKRFSNICILHILCAPSPPRGTLIFYSPWKVKIPKK